MSLLFFIINKYTKGKINKVIKKLYLIFLKNIKIYGCPQI